jgi:deazaflavin-dependent oxidoreductase (nitroreductase family)
VPTGLRVNRARHARAARTDVRQKNEQPMSEEREYSPSTWNWVAEQVAKYEASGGTKANTFMETGLPIVVVTMVGHKTGAIRKVPVMRVEHDGEYAIIASKGGMPTHPGWYHNLIADPKVTIQDGAEPHEFVVRLLSGDERAVWFERGIDAYPPYRDYVTTAADHGREIPVFVATRAD